MSLRLSLLHLRNDFICAIEDPTGGRSADRALRRLCKSLDCARRTEVVAASSDDRVCEGMASDEASEWNVVVGRIGVRRVFCLLLGVSGQLIQLPSCEVYRSWVSYHQPRARRSTCDAQVPRSCKNLHVSPKPQKPVSERGGSRVRGHPPRKRKRKADAPL
jgi:hypothetical protein